MNTQSVLKKSLVFSMTALLIVAILLSLVAPVMALEDRTAQGENESTAPSQGQGPTDPAELEAFLDDFFARNMAEYHIAGAAIAVVKEGKLFFAKGYGYADIEEGVLVDPEQTIFRIGSVGKTFTWTAVMQLVEQGKLDLDADVNTYLDFRIPDTFPQPITLKHLLTHTSGFEERYFGSGAWDAKDLLPVGEFMIAYMPKRVLPPGEYVGYTNYNAILAGYIVARVAGQPYEEYIQAHIFDPLGMTHSTVRPTMPPALRPFVSVGYTYEDGLFKPFPEYFAQPAGLPSGFHQVSVTDMARFMIAHLEQGRYSDAKIAEARILQAATAQQMHSTLYTPDPRLLGIAYGFFDLSDNGQQTIGHSGYAPPMRSLLLLLPDQHLGLFVAFNSKSAGALNKEHMGLQRAFFDHYYPAAPVEPIQPPADFAERADRFVGNYRYSSSPSTTLIKLIEIAGGNTIEVSDPGDGALLVALEGVKLRFVEVEPRYFRQADGPFHIVFREDDQGRITSLASDIMPHYAAVKQTWYQTPAFNRTLLGVCVLIFLSMIPVALIRWMRERRLSGEQKPTAPGARVAYWTIVGISILNPLITAGTVWGMFNMPNELIGPPLIMNIALGLGLLSTALTSGALVYMALAWKNRYWGITARAYYTFVTVTAVAFVWFLNHWNMLGWRL